MPSCRSVHFAADSPTVGGVASLPPLIPRALLFGNPERTLPKLSPDGKRLAYLAPREGVMNVWVRTVGQADDRPLTSATERPIPAFFWAENARQILFVQDRGGDENFHVYLVDVGADAGGSERDLTPFPNVRAMLVAVEPDVPDAVLLSMNRRDPRVFDGYRADLATGELALVAENPGDVVGWTADRHLGVRAAIANRPDGGSEIRVRDDEDGPWRTLLVHPFGEQGVPIGFTEDGAGLYVLTDKDANTRRLYRYDLASGERVLLHAREDVDMEDVLLHPTRRTVQAVAYNKARREWTALDPALAPDLEALRGVTDGDFSLTSRDTDDTTWLVQFVRDDGPITYYVYERASGKAGFLFTARPALEDLPLAKMTPVEVRARDGLTLQSYLTLPDGLAPRDLPLVLAVHGGPWARNVWGYSATAQWLANRGYAVLEVNYRGSTGFGKDFLNAGNREWAAKMHDDLVDAVRWAIDEGIADPARVAIYGGSYGGYAALVGLTFTPELFACGVDIVGPSNLLTLIASIPPYWEPLRAQFVRRIGDPATEEDFLRARSPLFRADKILRPLLIAQGANDPRVKQAESDQIVRAMRANGQEVTYLLFADEGHGFARPENSVRFHAAAEAFLAKHLGGRCEPAHPGEEPPLA